MAVRAEYPDSMFEAAIIHHASLLKCQPIHIHLHRSPNLSTPLRVYPSACCSGCSAYHYGYAYRYGYLSVALSASLAH